jgi:hypothetical protein
MNEQPEPLALTLPHRRAAHRAGTPWNKTTIPTPPVR